MALSAGMPLGALVRSLWRSGWGPLSGREFQGVRSTLTALANHSTDGPGTSLTTAYQISVSAGLSERWVRRCLHVLEELDIIEWRRGGVAEGKPQPSFFRIVKHSLVRLALGARGSKDERDVEHNRITRERLAKIRASYLKSPAPKRRLRRSLHAELGTSPHPLKGGKPPAFRPPALETPRDGPPASRATAAAAASRARELIRKAITH